MGSLPPNRIVTYDKVRAQYNLALMYEIGQGVPQDYAEAIRWYRRAAEQGNARAQSNLALMYYHGQGVNQNYAEAARWFRRAAKQGNAKAQFNLGVMYDNGQGVPQDFVQSHMWLNLAAAQGNETATNVRDSLASSMTSVQIAEARRLHNNHRHLVRPSSPV